MTKLAGTELSIDRLGVRISDVDILADLTLDVPAGSIIGLVGPNGSGKSTALRCVYRALRPTTGAVLLNGVALDRLSLRETARQVAALTQDGAEPMVDFTVAELVALGRTPHHRGNPSLSRRERDLCADAMARMEISHLADRGILQLSGGERQRAMIARALVQEPQLLVLDEPTNHLDLRHQLGLLRMLRGAEMTALVVLHDLNLAAAVCDQLGVLAAGRLVDIGPPKRVLTTQLVSQVFGIDAEIVNHPATGVPQLIFDLSSQAARETRSSIP